MTVASLATISTSRPDTRPMPVTMPAAGASSSYMPVAASGESSRKGEPRRAAGRCARAPAAFPARGGAARYFAPAALAGAGGALAKLGDELLHAIAIGLEEGVGRVDAGWQDVHGGDRARHHPQQSVLKPHAEQRQTACMRYISAPHRSHSILSSLGGLCRVRRESSAGVIGRGGTIGSGMRPIISNVSCQAGAGRLRAGPVRPVEVPNHSRARG